MQRGRFFRLRAIKKATPVIAAECPQLTVRSLCNRLSRKDLAEVVGDGVELVGDVLAERLYCADDDDGDQAGDQAVFNRGRAGLIGGETGENLLHMWHSCFPL